MREPDVPSPTLAPLRRAIVALIGVAAVVAVLVSVRSGTVASPWSNALGALLGSLAGTYIGERLTGFGGRFTATRIAWLQMAMIGLALVGAITWQSLPAYCQLPVIFVMGTVLVTAAVYLQRVRIGGSP